MDVRQLVGKRMLAKIDSARRYYGSTAIDEYRVLEVSPSGQWVKLMGIHGNKFWRAVSEVGFVEQLIDLRAEKAELENEK